MVGDWQGDNPYYLLCVSNQLKTLGPIRPQFAPGHRRYQPIDLDEPGWAATYAEWMRTEGEWHLVRKEDDGVALSIKVHADDQPYYTSRVFGNNKTAKLVRSYGIGKKQADGTMVRLWILDNGQICGGDDVDVFGPHYLE